MSEKENINKEYILEEADGILSSNSIKRYLTDQEKDLDIKVYKAVTSTNLLAKKMASEEKAENKVIVATSQTGGKGRLGRKFFSPDETGIYMSIIIRPKLSVMESTMLTVAAAVAVIEAIENVTGKKMKIKWVNDIYKENKKICGILTEATMSMESLNLDYAVVGIGINVFEPNEGFPEEIDDIATAIFNKQEKMKNDIKSKLTAEILNKFFKYYKNLPDKSFIEKYRANSLVIGKNITVISKNEKREAKAIDIDNECRLKVLYEDGTSDTLSSGEISIKLQ